MMFDAGKKQIYDVCIVGAGPAGSSLAIRLARSGLAVLLAERSTFPRHKLCGEFVSPECYSHFEELGIASGLSEAGGSMIERTVFYARSGRSVVVESSLFGTGTRPALGLSRAELDDRLLDRARSVGVDVREGMNCTGLATSDAAPTVLGIRMRDVNGGVADVEATLTVDATGRQRVIAKRFEEDRARRADLIAFKAHLRGVRINDGDCEIYAYPGGYGGCCRVENGVHNLCFIASASSLISNDPYEAFRSTVLRNGRAKDVLVGAEVSGKWLAVPISRFGRAGLAPAEGLITVGDAAAFIDPFTGSGILLALESSAIAADAITKHLKAGAGFHVLAREYGEQYAASFDRRIRVASVLRHAGKFPLAAASLIGLLRSNSRLRRHIARATRIGGDAV